MGLSYPYNLTNGTTADADQVQANLDHIKNNFDQDTVEDASENATAFQATKLPDTGSLPTSGREEIKTLRYQILQLMKLLKPAVTLWDEVPAFVSAVLTSPVINTSVSGSAILDEDDMASDSATQLATQQSTKAYVDSRHEASNWPSFSVHKNGTDQTGIADSVITKLTWSTELFDTNNDFASDRFTPTAPGKYLLSAATRWNDSGTQTNIYIYKNGATLHSVSDGYPGWQGNMISVVIDANGSSDYFEIYVLQDSAGASGVSGVASITWFTGCRIG